MKKLIIFTLLTMGLFVFCSIAEAKSDKASRDKSDKSVRKEKPQAPEFLLILIKGHTSYLIKDYEKALSSYKESATINPKSPLPHYFMGCALRALKKYSEALDSFKTAYLMAGENEWLKAVAAFNIAITYEYSRELEKAVEAWKDFERIASNNENLRKYLTVSESRKSAILKYISIDKSYEAVRQRIAAGKE